MEINRTEYYDNHYRNIHYKGLIGNFTSGYHKKLESNHPDHEHFSKVLEIGGGTGEHIPFVKHSFDYYVLLDIARNENALASLKNDSRSNKIEFLLADAREIPIPSDYYDRIVATCVLHHIPNLEDAICELRRVAKNESTIDLYLPCDPGLVYRWIRHWSSHIKQKKSMNLSWKEVKYLWAIEHRNHYLGIVKICSHIFAGDNIKIRRYPLRFASWNFNLYCVMNIKIQK